MSVIQAARNLRNGIRAVFTTDLSTRSVENPLTPITTKELAEIFDGTPANSGVSVTERTSLRSTVVLACVRLISEAIASLPLHVYERTGDRGRRKARDHSLYYILHDRPNEFMTSFTWRELVLANLLLWGNHYSEIQWSGSGEVVALWPLPPDRVDPFIKNGRLRYLVRLPDGTTTILAAERVFHVPGLGFDGVKGKSVIKWGKESIALSLAAEEFGARLFGNNANPGGVLETEKKLDDPAKVRLKTAWETSHGGLDKAHRIAVLEEGVTWKPTAISPDDAQALETRKFQVSEITRLFRVPPHLVGDVERSTSWGTGIEQQNIGLVTFTLRPWLVRLEQTFNHRLFLPSERRRYYVEHSVDGLLRGDSVSRNEALAIQRQWGIVSANEWREIENMNPRDDDGGDTYLEPLNFISSDQERPALQTPAAQRSLIAPVERRSDSLTARKKLAESFRPIYVDTMRRIARRERNDVLAAARKMLGRRDLPQLRAWLDEFFTEHIEFVRSNAVPVYQTIHGSMVAAVSEQLGKDLGGLVELDTFLRDYVDSFAARHADISKAHVMTVLSRAQDQNTDTMEALEEHFDEYDQRRVAEDTDWELVRSENAFAKAAYFVGGVSRLIWRTRGDSCPYCLGLNGRTIGISESFIRAGEEFQPDGDVEPLRPSTNIGHPPAHRGCDCGIEHSM